MAYEDDGLCEFSSVPCNMQSGNTDAAVAHSSGNKIDKVTAFLNRGKLNL